MVSPAGPGSGSGGTQGRSLTPASYHQQHSAATSAGGGGSIGKKRLHNHQAGRQQHYDRATGGMKKSKLAQAASASASAGPFAALPDTPGKASSNGFKRGIYLAFVDNALQEKSKGRPDPYNELVAQFKAQSSPAAASSSSSTSSPSKNGTTNIKSLIEALTHVVAQLDRSHSLLVDSVLSLPWTAMDESFVNSHMRFVRALLTSRSEFVQMTLEKIVKGFRFQQSVAFAAESANPDTITRRQTYERLHTLLSSLIYLIPTLPSTLWPVLNKYFPHKRESRNSQVVFISNALRIVEYCPQLGENVLTAVIVRALQIDVEIQVDIDDLEDDEGVLDEEVFGFSLENPFDRVVGDDDDSDSDSDDEDGTMNPDDISSDDGDSSDDEDARPNEDNDTPNEDQAEKVLSPKVIKRLKEMAAKLDAILLVMFKFLERIKVNTSYLDARPGLFKSASLRTLPGTPIPFTFDTPRGEPEENEAADYLTSHNHALLQNVVYRVLLSAFEEKILRTFQTRHTQFVLFWYASLSSDFADEFTGTLLGRVVNDEETPTVTRVAASGYVASFISRSSHIDSNTARQVMSLLCQCLDSELEQVRFASQAGPISGPEADRLVKSSIVFYAVAQAAFYIFCFRWRDFLDENEEEIDFLEGVPSKRRWMLELESLKMAVNSPLNPLKMCAQTVVSQFARMAHKTDFMYCHSIIEQNKRQSRSRIVVNGDSQSVVTPTVEHPYAMPPAKPARTASQSSQQPLLEQSIVQDTLREAQIDSHFPFDPYKLPLSAPFIQGIYRDWDGGGFDDDDTDEEEEEEEDGAEDGNTSTEAGVETRGEEENDDSSMAASSMDSDAIMQSLKPSFPSGAVTINGMLDPALISDDDEDADAFSKSFDAMSVSPRYNRSLLFSRS